VGNEAGNYKATQRDLSTWGPAAYTVEWKVGLFFFLSILILFDLISTELDECY
jgi:hypothetical protein